MPCVDTRARPLRAPDTQEHRLLHPAHAHAMGVIYKITSPSGRAYIGMTRGPVEKRWKQHAEKSKARYTCRAIAAAIQKYGWDNMEKEVLEEVDNSRLYEREKAWILAFDTYNNGYNLTRGGDDSPMLNPAVVARMRATVRANPELAKQRSLDCIAKNKEEWSKPGARERRGGAIRKSLNTPEMIATRAERHARMMETKEEQREELLSKLSPNEREKHRAYLARKRRERKARKERAAHESSGTTLRTDSQVSGSSSDHANGKAYTSEICETWWQREGACSPTPSDY